MEISPAASGGGGPAPFLLKTYDMVDDSSTDDIVSWSSNKGSFVVWNPPEFARILLPTYFKHNNFSSFIRQLNTYGFRKIDPEQWEFANEDFVKEQKHLLKNIHRRKPIHSHSNPQGSLMDPERATFEKEIERLSCEKASLNADVLRTKQQRSKEKLQLEDLTQRIGGMELRQDKLLSFLKKAIKHPTFVENLTQKIESMDFSAYNKKRRLPDVDHCRQLSEDSFLDNHSSSRPDLGTTNPQDFSNNLNLELSRAGYDINFVSRSTQSSNEDGGPPQINSFDRDPKDAQMMVECPIVTPEALELSDTGTSSKYRMKSSLLQMMEDDEGPGLLSLQQSLDTTEDNDYHISCQLNLTLASSPLQVNKGHSSARMHRADQELGNLSGSRSNANSKNKGFPPETSNSTKEVEAPQGRVNDVFWEQFLTERPGSTDSEEANSSLRVKFSNEHEKNRSLGNEMLKNEKGMDQLTL